nr:PREDICTED: odorant receptor 4-like [Megachile rotundata]
MASTLLAFGQEHHYQGCIKFVGLLDMIDNLSIAMPFSLVCIKLIVVWTNHGVLRDILSTVEEDCKKYAVIDTNNLIPKTASLSVYFTIMVMSSYVVSAVFYLTGTLTQDTNNNSTRRLLLQMDLPFDTSESPTYELVLSAQFLHLVTSALTFGVFSALLVMVIMHVGCHVDVMCQAITDDPLRTKEQLNFFINRHKEIILFVDKIEKLFTYMALSQLVSNTLITCCVGYLIVMSIHTANGPALLIKSVLFYIAICLEAFIYCFAGEYLSIKSKLIGDTAYESAWYDLRPSENRLLILLILRSQKGFTFTFGKFSSPSLESFTSIMKVSASYISVLLAMS